MSAPTVSTHEQVNLFIGLNRFLPRDDIISLFERVGHFHEQRSRLDELIAKGKIEDLCAACDVSRCAETIELLSDPTTPPHLFVTSYLGYPLMVLVYGAQLGIRFALLYETMADGYAQLLSRLGVRLISVERRKNAVHSYLVAIEAALKDGLHIATVFDSPHDRGMQVNFLGHDIRAAYFYAMIAFSEGLPIVPLYSLVSGRGVAIEALPTISNSGIRSPKKWAKSVATDLFSHLESRVLQNAEQYRWDESSVITSIPLYLIRAAEALTLIT